MAYEHDKAWAVPNPGLQRNLIIEILRLILYPAAFPIHRFIAMNRTPEPDLMNDADQAEAYALADFSEPHNLFVDRFAQRFPDFSGDGVTLLDLGCGAADVTIRFAARYPACVIHGVDGASAMLQWGQQAISRAGQTARINLIQTCLPDPVLPRDSYGGIFSNSLLHHLKTPTDLWLCIKRYGQPGSPVFIMDLLRPCSETAARTLVERYTATEPAVLQRDFFNSLCAAYTLTEVRQQLMQTGLHHLDSQAVSDRHFIVAGLL